MQTQAIRLHGPRDLRIEDVPLARPGPGDVVVRLGAGGICGSDLHYYHDGGYGSVRVREPIVMGHEAAGTVAEVGDGVALTVGTRVALNPSRPCGSCSYCAEGLRQHCLAMRFNGSAMRMPHEQGFFRQAIIVPVSQCHPVSAATTLAEAASAEPLAVCLHAMGRAPDLAGLRVLITGSGPIGVLCAALAQAAGASEVVVTDLQDMPLEVAVRMGASETVNVTGPDALARFEAGKGYFDVCFECAGAAPAIRSAIACTRPQGVIVQVGMAGDLPVPIGLLVGKEINLRGTFRFDAEFGRAVRLIDDGGIDVTPMISATYPMADALEAFAVASDRTRAVKVQIGF